jgi:glycerol-3-phosphate cytidylyltransferase
MENISNQKILYTGGTFDLFHSGHVNFLKQCKKLAHKVIVSLNSDDFIKEYKGKDPVLSFNDRKEILLSCRYVDEVIENAGGKNSKISISIVNPDIIAIGDDWARKDYYKQMEFTQEWLDEKEILLIYIPYKKGISTTDIKKRILE